MSNTESNLIGSTLVNEAEETESMNQYSVIRGGARLTRKISVVGHHIEE